jgi:DNA-binding transcriptional ArsR family regulator
MARAPTTLDSFSAVAEPKRRSVLGALARGGGELPVEAIVKSLGWPQPQVSKHLGVLRQVGLVTFERRGRRRMYKVNGQQLKPIFEWAKEFERFWEDQLDRIKERAEAMARKSGPRESEPSKEKP